MDHSDEKYQCKKMSDCPYTGTTVINKIPWGDFPAGKEPAAQEMKENVELAGKEEDRETEKSDTNSQALSDLQSEIRELRKKLTNLEEETGREINKLRREVETLKSENKGEGKAGAYKEVQREEEEKTEEG